MSNLVVLISLFSYVLGAIPFSKIVASFYNVDLTQVGSKNLGSTNVYRSLGFRPALFVFILDFSKGCLPVLLAIYWVSNPWWHVVIGALAIIGHSLSIFVSFKGGKGAATGLGVLAALSPLTFLFVFPAAIALITRFRLVAPVTIAACLCIPFILIALDSPIEYVVSVSAICCFIILRHHHNIRRLFKGTENKI